MLDSPHKERSQAFYKCLQAAKSRGFATFSLYDSGYCLSYPDMLVNYRRRGPGKNCSGDGLGGNNTADLYRINQGNVVI